MNLFQSSLRLQLTGHIIIMGIQATYLTLPPEPSRCLLTIYFADNLKGDLLMLHGMVDDNVEI
jgi:hypothetical protein